MVTLYAQPGWPAAPSSSSMSSSKWFFQRRKSVGRGGLAQPPPDTHGEVFLLPPLSCGGPPRPMSILAGG